MISNRHLSLTHRQVEALPETQTLPTVAEQPRLSMAACLHLNPSLDLASLSLSLLIQVPEAAAVVASGGDAGVE